MIETAFQAHLLRALNAPGRRTRFWRQNAGRFRVSDWTHQYWVQGAPEGAADLTGIALDDGLRIECEVKGTRRKWTTEQRRWAEFIQRAHGVYVLIRWMPELSVAENVAAGVALVDEGLVARRREVLVGGRNG